MNYKIKEQLSTQSIFTPQKSLLYIIIGMGIALRIWHTNWGLPELYEEATPLRIAWGFWNWNKPGLDFNPHFFNYPALTFYIQFIAQVANYTFGYIFGFYQNLDAFKLSFTQLAVTARCINVLFDTGVIVVIYCTAKEIADRRSALIAAALVAVNPSHIIHAHFIEVDPVLTFFSAVALLYIIRIYHRPATKWYILAGIFIALATATKYTGAFLILVLVGAHWLRYSNLQQALQSWKERPFIYSILISIAGFFLLNPYILLNYEKFQEDFSFEQFHVSYGHLGIVASKSTLGYYLGDVLLSSFGWLFCLILLGTVIHFLMRRQKGDLLLLLYPVIYLAIVSTWEMRAERYILPIFPILALIGSIGIVRFWDWLIDYTSKRQIQYLQSHANQVILLTALIILIIVQPSYTNKNYLRSLGLPDTRSLTKSWIQKNIRPGSILATGPFGIEFADSSYRMFSIPFLAVQSEHVSPFYDTRWYEDLDLVIASSYDYDRYTQEPKKYGSFLPYYDSLRTKWNLVYEMKPAEFQYGPAFWLYTYPDSLRHSRFDMTLFERFTSNPESARISNFLKDLNSVEGQKGKFEKCEQILKEILSVEVENNLLRNQLAQVQYNLGKYEQALKQLEISVRSNPNQAKALALAGSALIRLNQLKAAEGVFQRAIIVEPNFAIPYQELIQLYTSERNKLQLYDILKRYSVILPDGNEKSKINALIEQVRKIK